MFVFFPPALLFLTCPSLVYKNPVSPIPFHTNTDMHQKVCKAAHVNETRDHCVLKGTDDFVVFLEKMCIQPTRLPGQ